MPEAQPVTVEQVIRTRCTVKVLAERPLPSEGALPSETIEALIACAGWAPFHRPCHAKHQEEALRSIVPWRMYTLDAPACRTLREERIAEGDTSKLPQMLAAADALIVATWLPSPAKSELPHTQAANTCDESLLFDPTLENMEHIAAASAAIQNLLLAATAHGISNYWSSGGALRTPALLDQLNIPQAEILLGALFLFPADTHDSVVKPSKLRGQRGPTSGWSRRVALKPDTR